MQVDPNKHPSFIKIFDKESSTDKILIPPAFIKVNKKMLAKICLLKTDVAGMLWKAKIVRVKSDFFIYEGEWPQFVVHHKLELGDTLFFSLIDISTFHIMVFSQKSCKHIQVIEELSGGSEEEEDESSRKSNKVKMEPRESSAHATCTIESDDSIEILEGISTSHGGKGKNLDTVESSVENLGRCPLRQSTKRKREDDEREVEKLPEDIATHPFSRKGQKNSEGCKIQEQQSKIVCNCNQKVRDKEVSAAYQRATLYASQSKNPFLVSFMQQSYVFEPYTMSIKITFARKYFEENYGYLMLRVQGKGSWQVKCYRGMKKARVSTGWRAFVLDNKLKCGDACVFEVIKGTDQLFFDVTIFRADGNTPNVC